MAKKTIEFQMNYTIDLDEKVIEAVKALCAVGKPAQAVSIIMNEDTNLSLAQANEIRKTLTSRGGDIFHFATGTITRKGE